MSMTIGLRYLRLVLLRQLTRVSCSHTSHLSLPRLPCLLPIRLLELVQDQLRRLTIPRAALCLLLTLAGAELLPLERSRAPTVRMAAPGTAAPTVLMVALATMVLMVKRPGVPTVKRPGVPMVKRPGVLMVKRPPLTLSWPTIRSEENKSGG